MSIRDRILVFARVLYDLFLKLNPRKLAAHAVVLDGRGRVLMLRSRYADAWMLPGGGLKPGEHVDEALRRECREELGVDVVIERLTGLYYHEPSAAYVAIFRCALGEGEIRLSHEHTERRWMDLAEVPERLRAMVEDSLRAGEPAVRRVP